MDSTMTPVQRLAAALEAAEAKAYPGDTPDWERLAEAVLELFPADALAAVERVRHLHRRHEYDTDECRHCEVEYPCETIQALEGEQ